MFPRQNQQHDGGRPPEKKRAYGGGGEWPSWGANHSHRGSSNGRGWNSRQWNDDGRYSRPEKRPAYSNRQDCASGGGQESSWRTRNTSRRGGFHTSPSRQEPAQQEAQPNASALCAHHANPNSQEARPQKPFDQMSWEEKLWWQIPVSEGSNKHAIWGNLSEESKAEPNQGWLEHKDACARATKEEIMAHFEKNATVVGGGGYQPFYGDDEDDDDSILYPDDPDDFVQAQQQGQQETRLWGLFSKDQINQYIDTLPTCLLMTAGFHVSGTNPKHEEYCYCPLSHPMANWRDLAGLSHLLQDVENHSCSGKTNKRYQPSGLLAHLESQANSGQLAPLHRATHIYLKKLYTDFIDKGLMHPGFYNLNTNDWRRAIARQQSKLYQTLKDTERELKKQRSQVDDLVKKIDVDKKAMNELREAYDKLGLVGTEKAETITEQEMDNLTKAWGDFWDAFCHGQGICPSGDSCDGALLLIADCPYHHKRGQQIVFKLESEDFDVNATFDKWDAGSGKTKAGTNPGGEILFQDLTARRPNDRTRHFLFLFKADIKSAAVKLVRKHKQKDELKSVDEGGPGRHFLHRFWKELENLSSPVFPTKGRKNPAKKRVQLFSEHMIPKPDDVLRRDIVLAFGMQAKTTEQVNEGMERPEAVRTLATIGRYYRAVGRLFLLSVAGGIPISSHALPLVYRNYLFRQITLVDDRYKPREIFQHLQEIDYACPPSFLEEKTSKLNSAKDKNEGDQQNKDVDEASIYRTLLQNALVDGKTVALQHMKEGLTLGGLIPFHIIFETRALQGVTRLYFSRVHIDVEDVISLLCGGELSSDSSKVTLTQDQRTLLEVHLPNFLRDQSKKGVGFLSSFLEWATGMSYLPHKEVNKGFRILVLFDDRAIWMDEEIYDISDRLPIVHTCDHSISFPKSAYDGNKETLELKLGKAMEYTMGVFTKS